MPQQPPEGPQPRLYSTGGTPPECLLAGSEQLRYLIGAYLLAGITLRDESGGIVRRQQFHGRVTEVVDGVVTLVHADGELFLPADPEAYTPARPGPYRLASGEVVDSPDYLTTWSISPESD